MAPDISAHEASLEKLIEEGVLKLESLHPGGLALTLELAQLCEIRKDSRVLDVASGTGESACFLADRFGARIVGVDSSDRMILRAEDKVRSKGLKAVEFRKADAGHLPFGDDAFDVCLCECTLCLLEKREVLREMVRSVKRGGFVGMHDLCWKEGAPEGLKHTLSEIEGEYPETLEGWSRLFRECGLVEVVAVDRSGLIPLWMKTSKQGLGLTGQLVLALKTMRRWGVRGLRRVFQSERVFSSEHLGYAILVGKKP